MFIIIYNSGYLFFFFPVPVAEYFDSLEKKKVLIIYVKQLKTIEGLKKKKKKKLKK